MLAAGVKELAISGKALASGLEEISSGMTELSEGIKKLDKSIKREVNFDGDECETSYRVILENNLYSLLFVEIRTGKSHQIRAGFSALGYPLVGDELYGGSTEKIKRPALHCATLQLYQPFTNEMIKRDISNVLMILAIGMEEKHS